MTWHHCRTLLHGDYETLGPHVKGALFYLPEHLPTPPLLYLFSVLFDICSFIFIYLVVEIKKCNLNKLQTYPAQMIVIDA